MPKLVETLPFLLREDFKQQGGKLKISNGNVDDLVKSLSLHALLPEMRGKGI